MLQDQVWLPKTRSELGLPPFDPTKEDLLGSSVTQEVYNELWEALGDSPIGATFGTMTYLVRSVLCFVGAFGVEGCILMCVCVACGMAYVHHYERVWTS